MSKYDDDRVELTRKIELARSLERLRNNPDFRKVILNGFCMEEVINLNRLASREVSSEARALRAQQAQAGPVLETFFQRIENEGSQSQENITHLDVLARDDNDE